MKKIAFVFCMAVIICVIVTTAQTAASVTESKIVLENDKIKVTEYSGMPGKGICGPGKHNHPAHLTVVLNEVNIKITTTEDKTVEQKIPAGAILWSDAETHTVINNSDKPVKAYIIELK